MSDEDDLARRLAALKEGTKSSNTEKDLQERLNKLKDKNYTEIDDNDLMRRFQALQGTSIPIGPTGIKAKLPFVFIFCLLFFICLLVFFFNVASAESIYLKPKNKTQKKRQKRKNENEAADDLMQQINDEVMLERNMDPTKHPSIFSNDNDISPNKDDYNDPSLQKFIKDMDNQPKLNRKIYKKTNVFFSQIRNSIVYSTRKKKHTAKKKGTH